MIPKPICPRGEGGQKRASPLDTCFRVELLCPHYSRNQCPRLGAHFVLHQYNTENHIWSRRSRVYACSRFLHQIVLSCVFGAAGLGAGWTLSSYLHLSKLHFRHHLYGSTAVAIVAVRGWWYRVINRAAESGNLPDLVVHPFHNRAAASVSSESPGPRQSLPPSSNYVAPIASLTAPSRAETARASTAPSSNHGPRELLQSPLKKEARW